MTVSSKVSTVRLIVDMVAPDVFVEDFNLLLKLNPRRPLGTPALQAIQR
jgi:hypothetical protein